MTVDINGLHLYDKSNIKYMLCNKPFDAFLGGLISQDKRTPFLAIKNLLFFSLQVQLQVINISISRYY